MFFCIGFYHRFSLNNFFFFYRAPPARGLKNKLARLYRIARVVNDACHDIEVHCFFSEVSRFGSLRALSKKKLERNKTATG